MARHSNLSCQSRHRSEQNIEKLLEVVVKTTFPSILSPYNRMHRSQLPNIPISSGTCAASTSWRNTTLMPDILKVSTNCFSLAPVPM